MYKEILEKITNQQELNSDDVQNFINLCLENQLTIAQQVALLSALNTKGFSSNELSLFAKNIGSKKRGSIKFSNAIDICGTGGSGLERINTSTIASFILSALDVPIAKHGNKASSGRFGSFDLLESLGINIDVDQEKLQKIADQMKMIFLYAKSHHPVMKHFAEARKAIQYPTLFNLLGPLLSPAETKLQIIGTSNEQAMMTIAETCKKLGKKRVMVVRGEDGLDEVTITGKTTVVELKNGKINKKKLSPKDFGIKPCSFSEISGGNKKMNTDIALQIFKGECKTRHQDLVLVNVALALVLSKKTNSLKKAYQMGLECINSGKAYQQFLHYKKMSNASSILLDICERKKTDVLKRKKKTVLSKFIKKIEPSKRNFEFALSRNGMSLIAEIKKASPSAGNISAGSFSPPKIAAEYEAAGVSAISVVTDEPFFKGKLDYLTQVKKATYHTPILCKDFIIDAYQIYEARYMGADAILLLASVLSFQQIQEYLDVCKSLNMNALVEVHTEDELKEVLKTDAKIIGVNARNLDDFSIDKKLIHKLSKKLKNKILVAESGISTKADINRLPKKVDAILVGTTLMKQKNKTKKIISLIGKRKPLLKICGVQSAREALHCQKEGVDIIGLNFVPDSSRYISYQTGKRIVDALRKKGNASPQIAGVFKDHKIKEVNTAAKNLDIDLIQLSGKEDIPYVKKCIKPVIKGVSVTKKSDVTRAKKFLAHTSWILLDGKKPGSGEGFNRKYLQKVEFPYLLAGGINKNNIPQHVKDFSPYGFDIASGVEKEGKRVLKKISEISKICN